MDFLEQVVLGEIRRLTKYAVHYEDEFQQAIMGSTQKAVELERKLKQKGLAAAQARDGELDGLFERIYEDNISGKLSDERFAKMSQRYEEEQAELSEKIRALRKELDKLSSEAVSTDMFRFSFKNKPKPDGSIKVTPPFEKNKQIYLFNINFKRIFVKLQTI